MLGCEGSRMFRQVVLPARCPHLQRPASGPRLRLDPDRGRRDDRRADRPGLGHHGRPHVVAHRPRDLGHDHHRHRRASSPTAHRRASTTGSTALEPATPCLIHGAARSLRSAVSPRLSRSATTGGGARVASTSTIEQGRVRVPDRRVRLRQVDLTANRRGLQKPTIGERSRCRANRSRPGQHRGMVFQDYALFPWMTVRENIAFGPRQRGLTKGRDQGDRRRVYRAGGPAKVRRPLPVPAFRAA